MNQTIKKRIEEINSGIVPEGYEKTSFGIFPCDWKITRIKSIAYLNKQKFNPQENKDNLVCIELEHIVPERGVLNGNTYAQNKHSLKNTFCEGDILFGKLRPYLGKYYHADQKGVCSTEIWVIRNNNTIDNNFLFQLVKGKRFIQSAQDSAFGTKMPRAEWQKVEKEKFVIPTSFREQSRIAEVLMQWDKAIELQEKLIEAYQKLKKYYLKKMFPKKGSNIPEIRFPSFTAPWEQRKLGDIGKTYGGLSGKSKEDFGHGDARFVTYMNVFSNPVGDPVMTEAIELDDRQNEVKKGDVFFTTSSETPEEVGMSCVWMENTPNIYLNSFCFGYRPIVELDLYYLAYMLRSNTVRHKFIFLAQGISRYNISKNKAMEMFIPVSNMEEQAFLGAFFKNLDNLITLHQQKRDKLLKQRKAMQQYLLTGIVRV